MLWLYRSLMIVGRPLLRLLLSWRAYSGKEDAKRISERMGSASIARPAEALIWIHAASIGEALSALPLIKRLLEAQTNLNILVTTGTVSSAQIMAQHLPPRAVHQFVPIDHPAWVRSFLDQWVPDMAIWIESELWPNLILESARRDIPMALVNARISARSFQRWRRAPNSIKKLLNCFGVILAHNEQSVQYFKSLGATRVLCVGDLKQTAELLDADPEELNSLTRAIGKRPVWLAASTHPGEEAVIKEVHEKLRASYPDLLTIIAPRHANRGAEINALLQTGRFGNPSAARRSKGEIPTSETGVYLADTMGEMGLVYRLAKIAFMGGSLVPHGGQNPLEPARLGCAILHGPYVENFTAIFAALDSAGAARPVQDANDLVMALAGLLQDPQTATTRGLAAKAYALKGRDQVLEHIITELTPLLPKPG